VYAFFDAANFQRNPFCPPPISASNHGKERDMLPILLIAAAAALITACESSSSREKKVKRGSFKPMEETYTGLDLDSSSYRGESKSKKLMKRIDPFRPKKKDVNNPTKKPRPIGGSSAAKPPPIAKWKKKCTDDGHKVGSVVLDGHSHSSMACVSESGESCVISQYFDGRCTLD
jgi:hypothetical protein